MTQYPCFTALLSHNIPASLPYYLTISLLHCPTITQYPCFTALLSPCFTLRHRLTITEYPSSCTPTISVPPCLTVTGYQCCMYPGFTIPPVTEDRCLSAVMQLATIASLPYCVTASVPASLPYCDRLFLPHCRTVTDCSCLIAVL